MPTNYLLAIASYKEKWKQDFFDNVVSKRNKEYCELHNLEYIEITEGVKPVRGQYFWYKVLTYLFYPISPIYLYLRKLRQKEDSIRYLEKLSKIKKIRGDGFLIWIHVASVGEAMSILPLVDNCINDNKINKILLTSITLSSGKILEKKFESNYKITHQFLPLDIPILTNKFLGYIGNISYSLYLWHFVIIFYVNEIFIDENKIFNVFFSIILSFLSAAFTYKFIENPIRDKKLINFKKVIVIILAFYTFLIISSCFIYYKNGFSYRSIIKNIQTEFFFLSLEIKLGN